jgi:uncharacterized protein (DUF2384 family)
MATARSVAEMLGGRRDWLFASLRDIWGNDEDACAFLLAPHPELNGDRPLDRAMTELGGREVEEIIARAQYGFPV